MTAVGARTLLVNPPLVRGIAFTRQGRCQEREDVLGTTKPPYSLALGAALLRAHGADVRIADLTATRETAADLIARLDRESYQPTLIVFASTTPTWDADVAAMAALKARWSAPLFSFGPHASTVPQDAMARAPDVDGLFVGEPEDALLALAAADSSQLDRLHEIPSLTFRRDGRTIAHRAAGVFSGFGATGTPEPAWDLFDLGRYRLPLLNQPYVMVETSRGCPYSCDFCVAPLQQGHQFRERGATALVDEIEGVYRRFGVSCFYLWGDTVTLHPRTFGAFCDDLTARRLPVRWLSNARADNLVDPAFVARLRASGCWMLGLGVETASDATRTSMRKALADRQIRTAVANLRRARIRSFAFFILGYPGETPASLERTIDYAIDLNPDFANFYPAVPYPGTALYTKAAGEGWLASDDWSRMEYSHYLLRGNGLNERVVLEAIHRGRRRFYLRPAAVVRHLADTIRLVLTDWRAALRTAKRILFGGHIPEAGPVPAGTRQRAA